MGVDMRTKLPSSHEQELAMRLEQEREFEAWRRHLLRQRAQASKVEQGSGDIVAAAVLTYTPSLFGGSDREPQVDIDTGSDSSGDKE